MVTRHEQTCISVARCARIIFCSLTLSLSTCLAFLGPICWVQLKTPCLAPSHPAAASACSDQTHSSPCRSIPCPRRPETRANHLRRSVGHAELQRGHPRQDCHLLRHKPRLTGRQREKRRETLATTLLLLPRLGSLPSARDTCPRRCQPLSCSPEMMVGTKLKSVASGSSMTSCAALVAHAGCTRRRPGRRDSAGALPVRWSVGYPDRPRMPAAGLRRPPSRSARTTWPLWGSSLRAPSVAGDLPPPHRRTGFPQPPATLLPANRGGQACGPAARPARRSVAPQQQHQPGLRAAASSSADSIACGA